MKISKKTLEILRKLINEEAGYKSGYELVKFFNPFGFNDTYGQGFPSRWYYTDGKLSLLNDSGKIDECIKKILNPIDYIERIEELDRLIEKFNKYLQFDGYQIVRDNEKIEFNPVNKVVLDTQIKTSKQVDAKLSDNQSMKNIVGKVDTEKRCFVIMPFAEKYREVYEKGIIPAMNELGIKCERADDFYGPSNIVREIIENIFEADYIIADITNFKDNVMYELGIAHALHNRTIVICDEKHKKFPFDLSNYRIIKYKHNIDGITQKLKNDLIKTINTQNEWIDKPNNPVQDFLPLKPTQFKKQKNIAGTKIESGDLVYKGIDLKWYLADRTVHAAEKVAISRAVIDENFQVADDLDLEIPNTELKYGDIIILDTNGKFNLTGNLQNGDIFQYVGNSLGNGIVHFKIGTPYQVG